MKDAEHICNKPNIQIRIIICTLRHHSGCIEFALCGYAFSVVMKDTLDLTCFQN